MKAWLISSDSIDDNMVVFSDKRGQAVQIAKGVNHRFDDIDFTAIRAKRLPLIDKYYVKNKRYLDWQDEDDRLILVKECGFTCIELADESECTHCIANDWCFQCQDMRENEILSSETSLW